MNDPVIGSVIKLNNNLLTTIAQSVFQPIVSNFASNSYPTGVTVIDFSSSKFQFAKNVCNILQ